MSGLTDQGFTALRTADFLTAIRDEYDAKLVAAGYEAVADWDSDLVVGALTAIMAQQLGTLSEATQALYDAFDVDAATGVQLSSLARMVGVTRNRATYSTATVTITGTAGTQIPQGRLVEGGGEDDRARWETTEDATIGGGGTVAVVVQCTTAGLVEAGAGEIDRIVTPLSGWTSVTNAAAASAGQDAESDDELRVRRAQSLQVSGSRSVDALRANLLELDYVQAAVVIANGSASAETVEGVSMPASSWLAVLYPNTLTAAQKEEVFEVLFAYHPFGIRAAGTDVTATLTKEDGFDLTMGFDWATETTANVTVTVTLESGYVLGDVSAELEAAITEYIEGRTVGDPLRRLAIQGLAAAVEGIATATVLINAAAADLEPTITELVVAGTITVTT
jgi:uncharacterized phage protein gp47/JayE